MVLGHLTERELFRCRAVCRRWRDLALHADLWGRRTLYVRDHSLAEARAVLRSAPCLRKMDFYRVLDHCGVLAATTTCAAACLSLNLMRESVVAGALVLQNQAALGRLRRVHLELGLPEIRSPAARDLFEILHSIRGLVQLDLQVTTPRLEPAATSGDIAVPGTLQRASLKELAYSCAQTDPLLTYYLRSHAATLEEVNLRGTLHCPLTVGLLAAAPNLREVRCSLLEGLPALLQCRHLTILTLYVDVEDSERGRRALAGAEQFLRAATQLTTVELCYNSDQEVRTVCSKNRATRNFNISSSQLRWHSHHRPPPPYSRL